MDLIYLDNNATTPLLPAVWEAMRPYLTQVYGNPASAHQAGRKARQALEDAREQIAGLLDAFPDEVLFTSGATEANNLALFGLAGDPPGHLLASPIEHPSVVEPLRQLAEAGFGLDFLPVDPRAASRPMRLPPCCVPRRAWSASCSPITRPAPSSPSPVSSGKPARSPFTATRSRRWARCRCPFVELGVTTLSCSAHKFHGPKGIGLLLVRRGVKLRPRAWGGHQQRRPAARHGAGRPGRRPGRRPRTGLPGEGRRRERVLFAAPALPGRPPRRGRTARPQRARPTGGIPHTLNLSFPGLKADLLLMSLDLAGVACSTGSACSSGSLLPSPVLQAMGVPAERLHSALRFSLSPLLTEAEIDEAANRIATVVKRLRPFGAN